MTHADLNALLTQVHAGQLSVADAAKRFASGDIGFAHVDLDRGARCGFPEVIYCEGKTNEWVEGVVRRLVAAGQNCLATRVSAEQAGHLASAFPQADQDRLARTFW